MPKPTKNAEEIERKKEELARRLSQPVNPSHKDYYTILLERYARGEDVSRYSLVECAMGEFRAVLRTEGDVMLDGLLIVRIEELLKAAEERFSKKEN